MLAHVLMRRCFKWLVTAASIVDRWLYTRQGGCTHVPALVHKFRTQPDCLVYIDLER